MDSRELLKELLMQGNGLTDHQWKAVWKKGITSYPSTGDCAECPNEGVIVYNIYVNRDGLKVKYSVCPSCAEKLK